MTTNGETSSTAELLRLLTEDITALVRREIKRTQDELAQTGRQAARGVVLLGGAGALGALAAGTSAAVLLRTLDRWLPRPASALVVTALYGGAAAALASAGAAELRRAVAVTTREAVSDLRSDVRTATAATATPPGGARPTPQAPPD